jgi:hypothetical protein
MPPTKFFLPQERPTSGLVSHRGFLPSHRERVLEHFIRTDEDKQDIYE